MGKLVDAVSIDTFLGGNTYTRDFSGFYFDRACNPITDPERTFVGEEVQTIYAFSQARIFMEKWVSNQLTIKDLTAPVGPSTFGSDLMLQLHLLLLVQTFNKLSQLNSNYS